MARYTGPKCRLCRREGAKLFLRGEKCNSPQCPFAKRPSAPGEHGKANKKPSYYSLQLREKQKVKTIYGMLEQQFRRYFFLAEKAKGITGKILLQSLERRLDNVIFRLLFSSSRNEARQLIRHGFVAVNGGKIDIPSYQVKSNDVISLRKGDSVSKRVREKIESISKSRSVVSWLFFDKDNLKGEVLRLPEKEDLAFPVNENLIVELYSK